jgi:hypothetical protein
MGHVCCMGMIMGSVIITKENTTTKREIGETGEN